MRLRRASPVLTERARALRRTSTQSEALLWSKLRAGKLNGVRFHRQRPIGEYIADFYCPAFGLVVELDGPQHFLPEAIAYDEERTAYFVGRGLQVVRFNNDQVLFDTDAVVQAILTRLHPHPDPLPG